MNNRKHYLTIKAESLVFVEQQSTEFNFAGECLGRVLIYLVYIGFEWFYNAFDWFYGGIALVYNGVVRSYDHFGRFCKSFDLKNKQSK